MSGEFPFGSKRTALGLLAEPIVSIPVRTKYGYQNFDFLVDTGADCSIVPASLAADLAISLKRSRRIKFLGIGGEAVTALVSRITLKITAKPIAITCAFAAREQMPFILGRKDVFSKFSVLFDNARQLIRFIPLGTQRRQVK